MSGLVTVSVEETETDSVKDLVDTVTPKINGHVRNNLFEAKIILYYLWIKAIYYT